MPDYDEAEGLEAEDQPFGRQRVAAQKFASKLHTEVVKKKEPTAASNKSLSEKMESDEGMQRILGKKGRPRKQRAGESNTAYNNYLRGWRMRGNPPEYEASADEQRKALSPK